MTKGKTPNYAASAIRKPSRAVLVFAPASQSKTKPRWATSISGQSHVHVKRTSKATSHNFEYKQAKHITEMQFSGEWNDMSDEELSRWNRLMDEDHHDNT